MLAVGDPDEGFVPVASADAAAYGVGQKVKLEGRLSDGRRAAIIAYGLPLLLMLPVLFFATRLSGSEKTGALWALGSVALYYIVIFLFFRGRLQQHFSFTIRKV